MYAPQSSVRGFASPSYSISLLCPLPNAPSTGANTVRLSSWLIASSRAVLPEASTSSAKRAAPAFCS